MDKCMVRVRVGDAHVDDIKATIIKYKQKEKEKMYLMYMEMFTSKNLI